MLPAGNWKLDAAALPRPDGNNGTNPVRGTQQASKSPSNQPPRAIFVKLSDELLQQLKAAQSGNAAFQLELASPSGATAAGNHANGSGSAASKQATPVPVAFKLGDNSFPCIKPVNDNSTRNKVSDLVVQSSSIASSSTNVQLAANSCREHYQVGPSIMGVRHQNNERTPASMGERLRERNAQMQKEKESRKIVIVEDDGFSSSGTNGKGKKSSGKAAKSQPGLLRTSAITAKRSASPAGAVQRHPPPSGSAANHTSTASRPPNRLVANEAAKGLMKKNNFVQPAATVVDSKVTSPSMDIDTATVSPPASVATSAVTATVLQHPLSSTSTNSTTSVGIAGKSAGQAPQGSPARRQFHQMKVDTDDLASASSDSEDDDDKPLAVRTQSPIKTHFAHEPIPNTDTNKSTVVNAVGSKTLSPDVSRRGVNLLPSGSSTSSSESSDKETPKATAARTATSSVPKRLSPESAPASRAPSPGRSVGGPKTVAKTSGGSRLSRPVSKASPRTSPKPIAAPTLTSESSTSLASSASTSRPPSPPPMDIKQQAKLESHADGTDVKPSTLTVDPNAKPTSRAPSPLPSPGLHPLPPKPPASPSFTRQHVNLPSPGRPSPPPPTSSIVEKDKSLSQSLRPSLLPLGLPANPITGVMPNIPKSPSSLHPPPSLSSQSASTHTAHSTPGASPIISHFPNVNSARLSKSPNAGPIKSSTKSTGIGKRKDAPAEDQDGSSLSDNSSNKKKKLNGGMSAVPTAPSPLSASTGSEEDGEAEEEEGEYRPPPPASTRVLLEKEQVAARGRSDDVKPARIESTRKISDKPAIISKSGLPSFTKKGRMSELQESRDDSVPRSQSASRANTPVSFGSMDVDSAGAPISPSSYKPRVTEPLRINSEAEFVRRSSEFQDKLYPEYMQLYTRLEGIKETLSKGGAPPSGCSPVQISKMVDEVNERSKELEKIKVGLWQYNDARNGTSAKARSGSNGSGMTRVR